MVGRRAIREGFLEVVSLESWQLTCLEGYVEKGLKAMM